MALPVMSVRTIPAPFSKAYAATGAGPAGALLSTVTETGVAGRVLPAASRATAVSVWAPAVAVVVSQVTEYGDARVLRADGGAVERELHPGDADVVASRRRGQRRDAADRRHPPAGAVSETDGAVVSPARGRRTAADGGAGVAGRSSASTR